MASFAACVSLMYQQGTSIRMEAPSTGNKPKSEKTSYQRLLIAALKKEMEMARKLDPEKLASEIRKIGFSCQHCGKCCRQAFGDNRVAVIPSEVERIQEYTGLSKLEIAGPFVIEDPVQDGIGKSEEECPETSLIESEENEEYFSPDLLESLEDCIDCEGKVHAFGWILRRERNGDCTFLERDTYKCQIYPVRPMLCSTYPFYIEGLRLQTCECEGLGSPISIEDSRKLAEDLLFRYISELEDTLGLYENFVDFRRGEKGLELAKKSPENGTFTCIVHDSKGSTEISG
ncbi:YkgJ family cysteine cluster protein [Methanosarcina sp.]|uniref:YkgJ family cysteine cluster protein n=1 Tax=Methanosarcina sp. TaxID=2213 RepID=UPI002988694C|nr:YkgJ family cysteine cluster protein [Methanosarcina sp.]MDW5549819.1 YkgJ family cysteine cluster protein [Methanosarcina sp.]MDW5554831.1 YkgJ family cysteine cluster protein [Methanosarcina sp.]MDW5557961.1 YkgJ family cysteine cluster protein [Methanosarcina sp.]